MIEEVLYPAMEQGSLNIIIGKGPGARVIQLELPPFTLIAATTRIALLSSPLRSRFSGGTHRLEFYTELEIGDIIKRSAQILGINIEDGAVREIARRSRFTPRTANHLLKRARDYAEVGNLPLNQATVEKALKLLGIDALGLSAADRAVLEIIATKFNGGPVGLSTVATAMSEEEATVEEVYEPYLIQCGFIERTARGRIVTDKAYSHLNLPIPENRQAKLI
jgi:Holliday junction DNA helicase RuvB